MSVPLTQALGQMISGAKQLTAIFLAAGLVLGAYYVISMPLSLAIVYATDSSSSDWHRGLARLRTRILLSCPQYSDFAPAGPLIFLISNMESKTVDVTESRAIFKEFIQRGCDINAINDSGLRPIHAAILFRDPASLKFLIDLGADPNQKTGPESSSRYASRSAYLTASAYLAEICTKSHANCDDLRAILATANHSR